MALGAEYRVGNWTPFKAARELHDFFNNQDLVHKPYKEMRAGLRYALTTVISGFDTTSSRHFVSGVIAELCNNLPDSAEAWAREDHKRYWSAVNDKKVS